LQVRVPEGSRTGPIAVLKKSPDFTAAQALIGRYAACFPVEWSTSIFASVRMDVWAFPTAFAPPILEILPAAKETRPRPQPPSKPALTNVPAGTAPHGGPR
jgi:hypothetical protein